jgi:hypothetical protein
MRSNINFFCNEDEEILINPFAVLDGEEARRLKPGITVMVWTAL